MTCRARTVPAAVTSAPGSMRVTGVALVQRHPVPADRLGQPAGQPGRVDRRAVRGVHAAQHAVRGGDRRGRVPVEQVKILRAEPELARLGDLGAGPLQLDRGPGQLHGAALGPVTVDALGRHGRADLVDGLLHGPVHGDRGVPAAHPVQFAQRRREQGRAPAAVAPRGAETGDLPLAHHDPEFRARLFQVVRSPQAGEPGPGDRHVRVKITLQRVPRLQRARHRIVPERQLPVGQRTRHGVHGDSPRPGPASRPRRAGPHTPPDQASLGDARPCDRPGRAAPAQERERQLPDPGRLPRQHLPVADGRGRAARGAHGGRPDQRGRGGERGNRGLAPGHGDGPGRPRRADRARLRRVPAPGPAAERILAGPVRPDPRDGPVQPGRPARDGHRRGNRGLPDPAAAHVRPGHGRGRHGGRRGAPTRTRARCPTRTTARWRTTRCPST